MQPDDPQSPGGQGGQVVTPQQPPPPAPPPAPLTGPPQGTQNPQDQSYNFITNPPEQPKPPKLSFLTGASTRGRIILAGGSALVFLILILILRAIIGGGGNADVLINVAQDQQELVHLAQNASEEDTVSRKNKNFSATLQAAISSSQTQLVTYLANGGKKIKPNQLNLKVASSASTDEQLTAAAAAGTYNKAYEDVMRTKLNEYGKDLQQAYQEDKGPKGRAILSDSFDQAKLLGIQLNSEN